LTVLSSTFASHTPVTALPLPKPVIDCMGQAWLIPAHPPSQTHRRSQLAQVSYHEAVGLDFAGIRFERHYKVGFIS
jgi:hypothetical protein